MTKEHRILFGLDDLKAIRMRCCNCHADLVLNLEDGLEPTMPLQCPSCYTKWVPNEREGSAETRLLHAVHLARKLGGSGVQTIFELEDE